METIAETALRNQAPLPNQSDCGGRLEARPISQPRCQRMIAERTRLIYPHSRSIIWLGRVGSSSRYAIKAGRDKK